MASSSAPFVIFGLPRSRTAWLSRFLTCGNWICGHDEVRYMRSLDDVATWFKQPFIGSVETGAAPWWRLLPRYAPNARVAVVRRPVADVVDSLMRIPGAAFDRDTLTGAMTRLDVKLGQIERRVPGVLSVRYDDLGDRATAATLFEHCLGEQFDPVHWGVLKGLNIQISMPSLMRYVGAYLPALNKLGALAKQRILADLQSSAPRSADGMTFQCEPFESWLRDARQLLGDHLLAVGEEPDAWRRKNLPLMRHLYDVGAMQIMTARSNGRLFGYLMTMIGPSLTSESVTTGSNAAFFASTQFPGLGLKLQRAALAALKERGVGEAFLEAGTRGDGPRLGAMYRRLGAVDHGHVYRIELGEF